MNDETNIYNICIVQVVAEIDIIDWNRSEIAFSWL